jgi:hypothetical protein
MADANGTLVQDTASLHLDEVTGERVSKSELKKRQKQRQLEEKKAAKAAAAPPKQEKKKTVGSEELDESNLNPNVSQSLWALLDFLWYVRLAKSLPAILRDSIRSHKQATPD